MDTTGKGTINYRDFLTMMLGKSSSVLRLILLFEGKAKEQAADVAQSKVRFFLVLVVFPSRFARSLSVLTCACLLYADVQTQACARKEGLGLIVVI